MGIKRKVDRVYEVDNGSKVRSKKFSELKNSREVVFLLPHWGRSGGGLLKS
jgi:hypothetical protein